MMMMMAATEGKRKFAHCCIYIYMKDEVSFVISVLIYDSFETIS